MTMDGWEKIELERRSKSAEEKADALGHRVTAVTRRLDDMAEDVQQLQRQVADLQRMYVRHLARRQGKGEPEDDALCATVEELLREENPCDAD